MHSDFCTNCLREIFLNVKLTNFRKIMKIPWIFIVPGKIMENPRILHLEVTIYTFRYLSFSFLLTLVKFAREDSEPEQCIIDSQGSMQSSNGFSYSLALSLRCSMTRASTKHYIIHYLAAYRGLFARYTFVYIRSVRAIVILYSYMLLVLCSVPNNVRSLVYQTHEWMSLNALTHTKRMRNTFVSFFLFTDFYRFAYTSVLELCSKQYFATLR